MVKKFLEGAEEKLKEAMEEAKGLVGELEGEKEKEAKSNLTEEDIEDDLELPLQPLTLLMDSLVSDDSSTSKSSSTATSTNAPSKITTKDGTVIPTTGSASVGNDKERIERAVVTPWMRFCWEAYKSCLEICKSNARLEVLYNVSSSALLEVSDVVTGIVCDTTHVAEKFLAISLPFHLRVLIQLCNLHSPSPFKPSNSVALTSANPNSVDSANNSEKISPTLRNTLIKPTPSISPMPIH